MHIAALAALLKVPQAKLEALEADRYADLPDATFARALAKAVCRTLKVDAAPVMELLPRGDGHELHVSLGINEPYRETSRQGDGFSAQWLQKPVVWGAGLLVLASVGIYEMPAGWLERAPAASVPGTASVAASVPASESVLLAAPAPMASEAQAEISVPAASSLTPASPHVDAPISAPAPAPVAAAASVAPKLLPVAASPASAPAAGELTLALKMSAPSWVEVVDARGQTLISRTVPGGEEASLSGAAPLKVKIGNVAGTQLLVRGKPVDLPSQAKDNVARLELN
ncbi:MAG: DUF4115 domain-containing protein [Paucibacter sp.]|nr:DUF4115 domain-containing protein [Roseateles sp.]